MGISDKDYANALEHQRLHERALMKLEVEQMKENSLTITTGSHNTGLGANVITTTTGTGSWENRSPLGIKTLNEQDLHHEAMKAPLSALVDMWTMRWQGEWVNESEFIGDDFWRLALIRLTGANKLEKHNLANQYTAVYRIIE